MNLATVRHEGEREIGEKIKRREFERGEWGVEMGGNSIREKVKVGKGKGIWGE